jgi:hypothetical protein
MIGVFRRGAEFSIWSSIHPVIAFFTTQGGCHGILLRPVVALPVDVYTQDRLPGFTAAVRDLEEWYGDARHFGPLVGRTVGGVTVRSPVDAAAVLLGKPPTGQNAPSES